MPTYQETGMCVRDLWRILANLPADMPVVIEDDLGAFPLRSLVLETLHFNKSICRYDTPGAGQDRKTCLSLSVSHAYRDGDRQTEILHVAD